MVSRLVGTIAVAAVIVLGLSGHASAQFPQLIPTRIELVKFGGSPAVGRLYKFVSKAPRGGPLFQLPSTSPATTGGSLTVTIGTGALTCTLAPGLFNGTVGWKELGSPPGSKGYKYLNKSAPTTDPCKVLIVKEKVIKVIALGTGTIAAPVDYPPGSPDISTVLTLGGDDYCAYAVKPHFREKADRYIKAKDEDAPGSCPGVPTTTTTLPPTTTTLPPTTTTLPPTTTTLPPTTTTLPPTTTTTTTSTTTTTTTTTTTIPPLPLDHYRLYDALGPDAPLVHIEDQFHVEDVDLGDVTFFLVPVDKNGEGIINPIDHLTCYDIPVGTFAASVTVDNQFGTQSLEIEKPDAFCVPTEKFPDPVPTPLQRDHYKCYEASGNPVSLPVSLLDQFEDQPGVLVLHPTLFCNPADKNGEGIWNDLDHLTCYFTDPPGVAPGLIPITNQFHQDVDLDVGPSMGLCVPSFKLEWTPRFVDNGDGTITDLNTGLMWEKKDDNNAGGIHDKDNRYRWAGCCDGTCSTYDDYCQPNAAAAAACSAQTGDVVGCGECSVGTCDVDPGGQGTITTIWDWLVQVNAEGGTGFAGYSDWRIPSEDGRNETGCLPCEWASPPCCPSGDLCAGCEPQELETILLESYPCGASPCVDSVFNADCGGGCTVTTCSCTASNDYWSSSSSSGQSSAWWVSFNIGFVGRGNKLGYDVHVRAVRGGSSTTTTTLPPTTTTTVAPTTTTSLPTTTTSLPPTTSSTTTTTSTSTTTTTTLRFVDNGDGTITDIQTGLMWEKKDRAGGIHDVDKYYTWVGCCDGDCSTPDNYCQPNAAAAAACSAQTGDAVGCTECSAGTCENDWAATDTIWGWLVQVNTEEFAGHSDWRIPEVNRDGGAAELETILLEPYPCGTSPCVDSVFNTGCTGGCTVTECSCTWSYAYWSGSSGLFSQHLAWGVNFNGGNLFINTKSLNRLVRAVRGGS